MLSVTCVSDHLLFLVKAHRETEIDINGRGSLQPQVSSLGPWLQWLHPAALSVRASRSHLGPDSCTAPFMPLQVLEKL